MSTAFKPSRSNSSSDQNVSPRRRETAGLEEGSAASLSEVPVLLCLPDLSDPPLDLAPKSALASQSEPASTSPIADTSEPVEHVSAESSEGQLTQSEIASLKPASQEVSDSQEISEPKQTVESKATTSPVANKAERKPSSRRRSSSTSRTDRRENRRRRVESNNKGLMGSGMQLLVGILLLCSLGAAYVLLVNNNGDQNLSDPSESAWNSQSPLQAPVTNNSTDSSSDNWTWSSDSEASSENQSHSAGSGAREDSVEYVARNQDPREPHSAGDASQPNKPVSHFLPWRRDQENLTNTTEGEAGKKSPTENISSDYPSTDLPPLEGVLLRSLQTLHRHDTPRSRTAERQPIDRSGSGRSRDTQYPPERL